MAGIEAVPVVSALDITPERFQAEYIDQNQPVVLRDATTHWAAASRWTLDFFRNELGEQECDVFLESRHRQGEKWHTTFREYIEAFDRLKREAAEGERGGIVTTPASLRLAKQLNSTVPYCRAWYFEKEQPTLLEDFDKAYFEDGFKRWKDSRLQPPFTWIFVGPAGAATPLHCDVWYTDAWLAQLVGRKQFRLWHPDCAEHLQQGDKFVDMERPDLEMFPLSRSQPFLQHTLQPGEIIFLPSKWAHDVRSLDDTVSVTSNFLPKCNLPVVSPPYKQWISKQFKMIERMSMLKKLKAAKLAAMEEAKLEAQAASSATAPSKEQEQRSERMGMIQKLKAAKLAAMEKKKQEAEAAMPALAAWSAKRGDGASEAASVLAALESLGY